MLNIYIYIHVYGNNVFDRPHPVFSICARFRHVSQQLCTFHRSCAGFTELCTFHKPPNNVRVQLLWGDQTHSPDIKKYMYYR